MGGQPAGPDVLGRIERIGVVLAAGQGRFDPVAAKRARDVVDRAGERLRFGADHTVVALVGATGSGKSSLFNALAEMEVAEIGVRRPTTGEASACVWSVQGADALLDWLGVPARRRTNRQSVLDADRHQDLHGLVLLDLPDHDSTVTTHRLEVDRLVDLVDLLIWVVDPQKYADEALHSGYLRRLAGHQSVMLVVLNQLDRLTPAETHTCATDLRRLLDSDGLTSVTMLTTSARTGAGIDDLRAVLTDLVARGGAFAGRAGADLDQVVDELRGMLGPTEPDPARLPGSDQLVSALARSAGLPVLLDAIGSDYLRGASARTQWPPVAWWQRLRPDSLQRLGLAQDDEAGVRELIRPTPPVPSAAQRSRVEAAVRAVTDATAEGLPARWADDVREAAVTPGDDVGHALDEALRGVDLALRRPPWWTVVYAVQVALLPVTAAGLLWCCGLVVARWAGSGSGTLVQAAAAPLAMLIGGAVLGALVALAARWSVLVGARRRRQEAAERLRSVVSAVALERVIAPIAAVVIDHRTARQALGG
jgi:GTP-binding protein EngB required for normal cell division